MSKRKVLYAKLHQTAFLPAPLSDLGSTLPPRKTFSKFDMTYSIEGIHLEVQQGSSTHYGLIPWGNVAAASLGPPVIYVGPAVAANQEELDKSA